MAALALLPDTPSTLAIVWPMALCGIGFGFFQAPNMRAIMSSVPPARSGAASGVVAGARLLGQTLGAALVALCFHIAQPNQGPELALWLGCGFAAVGSVTSVARLLARSHRPHR
jgi:DHA2 family multidrug resistance protein-like MFS transporter